MKLHGDISVTPRPSRGGRRGQLLARAVAALSVPVVLAGAGFAGGAPTASGTTIPPQNGILPPNNPSKSLAPSPAFQSSTDCLGNRDVRSCNVLVQQATTAARLDLESLGRMRFDITAYDQLTKPEQLFALVNIERRNRGLPAVTELTSSLDHIAYLGALANGDPSLSVVGTKLPGGGLAISAGGNWASGFDNPFGSNYAWMYDDGPNSPNTDCTTPHAAGCWGHRDNILRTYGSSTKNCAGEPFQTVMGASFAKTNSPAGDSETELFVGVCGKTPTDVVTTWAKVKALISAH